MSAPEVKAKIDTTISGLKVAHTTATGVLREITEAIKTISSLESNSPDAAIALQALQQLEQSMEDDINILIETIEDLINFRQVV
jgi:conjugal transfer/entry exclusion protein